MGIYDLLLEVYNWLTVGIYDLVVDAASFVIQASVYASLKATAGLMMFSWDIAKDILSDLQITAFLNSMYSHIDSEIFDMMLFFRLPETFSTIINAYITRYVFKFLGGSGIM